MSFTSVLILIYIGSALLSATVSGLAVFLEYRRGNDLSLSELLTIMMGVFIPIFNIAWVLTTIAFLIKDFLEINTGKVILKGKRR